MTKSREENEQLDKQEQHPCCGAQNPAPVSPVRDFFRRCARTRRRKVRGLRTARRICYNSSNVETKRGLYI